MLELETVTKTTSDELFTEFLKLYKDLGKTGEMQEKDMLRLSLQERKERVILGRKHTM